MDRRLDRSKEQLTEYLRGRGKATNREMIDVLGGDRELFERAREALILDEVADDRKGVGLVFRAKAGADAASTPAPAQASSASPLRPLRIFLSYGHDEFAPLAEKLLQDLKQRGHEVWFDRNELRAGAAWERSIEAGLDWVAAEPGRGFVILLMTPHSVRRPNGYCLNEVAYALNQRVPIVPAMLVDVVPPLSISAIQWLDLRDCVPIEERGACYARRLPALIAALEHNSLDFEGAQSRLFKALRPISCAQDIEYHLPRFTGRRWLFRQIDEWLADRRGPPVFWITGGPGSGKSAIAAWLSARRPEVVAFHICKSSNSMKADPAQAVRSIAWQLSTQLPDYLSRLLAIPNLEEACEKADAATLFDLLIIGPLHRLPAPDHVLVMLIDGLDEATRFGRNELARFLAEETPRLPDWMRMILTSTSEIEVTQHLQALDPVGLAADSAESNADVAEYIQAHIASLAPGGVLSSTVLATLMEVSERNWLYIEWIWRELKSGRLSLSAPEVFPKGLGSVYRHLFEQRFPDIADYARRGRPLLEIILVACEPMQIADLVRTMHVSSYAVDELLRAFGALLEHFDQHVRVFHRSVLDWLVDGARAGDYLVDPRAGHQALADAGWAEYLGGVAGMSEYMKRWLPAHLAAVDRKVELEQCITDARFVGDAFRGGRHLDLARFWGNAAASEFVRRCEASYDQLVGVGDSSEHQFAAARGLGQLFQHCGVYEPAIGYFEKALAISSTRGDADAIGFAHLDIGWCCRHVEAFERAVAHVDEAIQQFERSGNRGGVGQAESIKGICLWHLQQDLVALEHLELARARCAEAGDCRGEAEALNHLGIVRRSLGQYEKALEDLHLAEAYFTKNKDLRGLGKCCNSLGTAYWWSSQHDKAIEYYEKADTFNERTHQRYVAGLTANNLGYLYLDLGQHQKAYDSFLRARSIRRQLRTGGYEMMDVSGLALACHRLGDTAAARRLSQEALDGLRAGQPVEDMVRAYYNHWLIMKDGDPAGAAAAAEALATAKRLVAERVARIREPQARAEFVARVPLVRELQG